MPEEIASRREILKAIESVKLLSDLTCSHKDQYDFALELEVIVYGRNYDKKQVGPYVRLLTYEKGEIIVKDEDWAGNKFYVVVDGAIEVLNREDNNEEVKVEERLPGSLFGVIAVLKGGAYNATFKAPESGEAKVLEIQRPALRLLRKLPRFGKFLDEEYSKRGRNAALEEFDSSLNFSKKLIDELREISSFKVLSKNHLLCREGSAITRLFIIKDGWVRLSRKTLNGEEEEFFGKGWCFGLEGVLKNGKWPYTITLSSRSEVLEIPIVKIRQRPGLKESLFEKFDSCNPMSVAESAKRYKSKLREKILPSQKELIDTGFVDGTNLLVMDMDLCIRCGNCSKACHEIHGRTRLTRRGIHVSRLKRKKPAMLQSALMPQVCLHCKDPECLTGCPTGAISRTDKGYIDIHPKTCIGCGDCASQCPYDAISLIPRKTEPPAPNGNNQGMLRKLFNLKSEPLPRAVETAEDMVAIKCNMCADRPINPKGSKTARYSCEDNCPTGALARIEPREYFDEIKQIEGPIYKEKKSSSHRNIHKLDWLKIATHIAGIALFLTVLALTRIGFQHYGMGEPLFWILNMRWITGIAGTVGIIGATVYMARRRSYLRRHGYLKIWLLAHYYLGAIAAALILLHGGAGSGGIITWTLAVSFDLVILTGLFGCFCYFFAPRMMTRIEGAPLLLEDLRMRREELQEEIKRIVASKSEPLRAVVTKRITTPMVSLNYLLRQYLRMENLDDMIEAIKDRFSERQDELLRLHIKEQGIEAKFEEVKKLFIEAGNREALIDRLEEQDAKVRAKYVKAYDGVKADWPEALNAVEVAATLCRVNALIYLHQLLKAWLWPHVFVSSLMVAFLVAHIIQVIYFA